MRVAPKPRSAENRQRLADAQCAQYALICGKSVSAVVREMGFEDRKKFCDWFRRQCGSYPMAWLVEHKRQEEACMGAMENAAATDTEKQ